MKKKVNNKNNKQQSNSVKKKKTVSSRNVTVEGNNKTVKPRSSNNKIKVIVDDQVKRVEVTDKNYRPRHQKKTNKWYYWVLLLVFIAILLFSSLKLVNWLYDNKKIEKINKEIEKVVTPVKKDTPGETVNPPEDKSSDYWDYMKLPFLEVNFNDLLSKNKETVGFIHIDNTNINYPIVQTSNNEYYLTHAFDKSYNSAGWVFMDYRNKKDELSDNTVIYGHGRLDTTVFGSLKNVLAKSWQENKNNYIIYISTTHTNMLFQIFSIYTIPAESYYIETSFASNYEKQKWLNKMKERNIAPIDTSVDINDKIITLSTCENNDSGRIVVQGKLIKKESR